MTHNVADTDVLDCGVCLWRHSHDIQQADQLFKERGFEGHLPRSADAEAARVIPEQYICMLHIMHGF